MPKYRTRIKAELKSGITEVKALVKHPMEIGGSTDLETDIPILPHFITEVECTHQGKVVMSALWSSAVSKNPFCAFKFKGGAKGERIDFTWKDNQGNKGSSLTFIK
jgi:sulfur-oxidizing protein SoxZ